MGTSPEDRKVYMPKTKATYRPEFRAEAKRLCRDSGQPRSTIARDLGISTDSFRAWMRRDDIDSGKREGLTTTECDDNGQLTKENRILREEREILKKAAAFLSVLPRKDSGQAVPERPKGRDVANIDVRSFGV